MAWRDNTIPEQRARHHSNAARIIAFQAESGGVQSGSNRQCCRQFGSIAIVPRRTLTASALHETRADRNDYTTRVSLSGFITR